METVGRSLRAGARGPLRRPAVHHRRSRMNRRPRWRDDPSSPIAATMSGTGSRSRSRPRSRCSRLRLGHHGLGRAGLRQRLHHSIRRRRALPGQTWWSAPSSSLATGQGLAKTGRPSERRQAELKDAGRRERVNCRRKCEGNRGPARRRGTVFADRRCSACTWSITASGVHASCAWSVRGRVAWRIAEGCPPSRAREFGLML